LKWPNDLVVEASDGLRKLAGVLGETDGLGSPDPRVVVGLGINTDWPAEAFPPELAASMTSLRQAAGGRAIDDGALLEAFIERLAERVMALRSGRFDASGWTARQVTTGRTVRLERSGGSETVRAAGVDPVTGALIVVDEAAHGGRRQVVVGEITHVRLADPVAEAV
jgi:biotin-(acetyl-CoA carboxylase) ligase